MRILIEALFVALTVVVAAPSSADAQSCQCVCRYDRYGHRHCHKVCSPAQYAAPQYSQPYGYSYAPTQSFAAPFEIDPSPLIVLAVLAAIIAGVIAAVSGSSNTGVLIRETEDIRANTVATRALTEQTRAQTRELDNEFAARARQSYDRGRAAADDAWERMMDDRRG